VVRSMVLKEGVIPAALAALVTLTSKEELSDELEENMIGALLVLFCYAPFDVPSALTAGALSVLRNILERFKLPTAAEMTEIVSKELAYQASLSGSTVHKILSKITGVECTTVEMQAVRLSVLINLLACESLLALAALAPVHALSSAERIEMGQLVSKRSPEIASTILQVSAPSFDVIPVRNNYNVRAAKLHAAATAMGASAGGSFPLEISFPKLMDCGGVKCNFILSGWFPEETQNDMTTKFINDYAAFPPVCIGLANATNAKAASPMTVAPVPLGQMSSTGAVQKNPLHGTGA